MKIPQKLLDDFEQLRECLIILRRDYNTYTELFCDENRALLTAIAPNFFSDISEILQRDWKLQVVKLMDNSVTNVRGEMRENLTIKLINQQLDDESLLTDEIRNESKGILEYGDLLTLARHRILAHRDRKSHVEDIAMGATTSDKLMVFIQNIQNYNDLVGIQIGMGPLDFSSTGCRGDVYDFLRYLRNAQNSQQENQAVGK